MRNFLLILCVLLAAHTATAADQDAARIHGQVVTVAGAPVRGAVVVVTLAASRTWTVSTDDAGAFDVRGLPAGSYTLQVSKAGFLPIGLGATINLGNLKSGDSRDAGTIPLRRAAAIAGVVRDEYGEPVAGLSVSASRAVYSPPGSRSLLSTKEVVSNDLGEYRLFGLEPGTYYVAAAKRSVSTFFPSARQFSEAQPLRLAQGEDRRGIDITLGQTPLWRVSGRVTMTSGVPAREVGVTLAPQGESAFSAGRMSGRTDSDGAFSFVSVPPGSYVLHVSQQQAEITFVVVQGSPPVQTNRIAPFNELATVPIEVAGDVSGLEIRTSRGFDIRGRILVDGGPPSADLRKRLSVGVLAPDSHVTLRAMPLTAEVLGDFVIAGASPGRTRLGVVGLPAEAFLSRISMNGIDVTDEGFEVSAPVRGIEIAITTNSALIAGTVTTPVGERARGTVLVFSENNRFWTLPGTRYLTTSLVSASGEFRISKLPPGRYLAVAVASYDALTWADPENLAELRKVATPFAVPESGTVTLNLVRR